MKKGIISAVFFMCVLWTNAQEQNTVVMKVGTETVPLSEFEFIFLKNHPKDKAVTRADLDEYLDLFVNFKLKVLAAKKAGIDTSASLLNEFNGYRKQLAQSYLKDKETEERLLTELTERLKTDLNVSHILLKAKSDCMSPADTMELYKKSLDIRKRILGGEAFEKVANEVSEDNFSNKNGGALGWFTALMWAYPFESAAYSLKKGDISMPVKTALGYHLIRVSDSRPARGDLKVAHIFVAPASQTPEDMAKAKTKADEAYAQLQAGTPWMEVVSKYSEDKTTVSAGGELPVFGIGKMVQEFEDASYGLQNIGDYSAPVATKYGYHIIKLLNKIDKNPGKISREELRKQLIKSPRYKIVGEQFAAKAKKEFGFTDNKKTLDKIRALETASKSKTIRMSALDSLPNDVLFTIGGKNVTISNLSEYMKARISKGGQVNYCNLEVKYLNPFIDAKALEAAEANLEKKYADYKSLVQEYREGIMIFEMMNRMVWNKAVEDTAGLAAYHEQNKSKYMWKERIVVQRIIAGDSAVLEKVRREAAKVSEGKKNLDYLKSKFNKKEAVIALSEVIKEPAEFTDLGQVSSDNKIGPVSKSKENYFFYLYQGTRAPEPKDLKSAKGAVITDYQNFLETEWISELKRTYPVTVFKDVMYKLVR
jgi:peptidyl-prolyl cis-trans isomerase SurA